MLGQFMLLLRRNKNESCDNSWAILTELISSNMNLDNTIFHLVTYQKWKYYQISLKISLKKWFETVSLSPQICIPLRTFNFYITIVQQLNVTSKNMHIHTPLSAGGFISIIFNIYSIEKYSIDMMTFVRGRVILAPCTRFGAQFQPHNIQIHVAGREREKKLANEIHFCHAHYLLLELLSNHLKTYELNGMKWNSVGFVVDINNPLNYFLINWCLHANQSCNDIDEKKFHDNNFTPTMNI